VEASAQSGDGTGGGAASATAPRPYTLIAELTYRCALHCPYCSNPVDLARRASEMDTAQWLRIFAEAEALGVVQLHLTGGEPLARRDLEALVAGARAVGVFTNLITSGVPVTRERLAAIKAAGIDAVQLSVQGVDGETSRRVAGLDCFDAKLQVARWVRELDLPLTLNVVLHRDNLDRVEEMIALAEHLGAHRIELANTQYLGWALANREALLPTRSQLDRARDVASAARKRLQGRLDVLFVLPDYFADHPRACMDGWARRFIDVTPDGTVLPCQAAASLPGLAFESARDGGLAAIWESSPAMRAYRGDAWMPEPCRSCDRRATDFGGCRCQAFALTGDAAATDPACALSPHHAIVERAREASASPGSRRFLYRGGVDR
jgi:pyrroloquinoline quinone biosynthesis protein E